MTPPSSRASVSCRNPSLAPPSTPSQARIVGLNSQYFLKNGGFFVISIKASCIDSTAPPEAVFAREVKKLQEQQLKPTEQVRLSVCVLVRLHSHPAASCPLASLPCCLASLPCCTCLCLTCTAGLVDDPSPLEDACPAAPTRGHARLRGQLRMTPLP